jgi:hypothetical protein
MIMPLPGLKSLQTLNLRGCKVTDLKELAGLKNLDLRARIGPGNARVIRAWAAS